MKKARVLVDLKLELIARYDRPKGPVDYDELEAMLKKLGPRSLTAADVEDAIELAASEGRINVREKNGRRVVKFLKPREFVPPKSYIEFQRAARDRSQSHSLRKS